MPRADVWQSDVYAKTEDSRAGDEDDDDDNDDDDDDENDTAEEEDEDADDEDEEAPKNEEEPRRWAPPPLAADDGDFEVDKDKGEAAVDEDQGKDSATRRMASVAPAVKTTANSSGDAPKKASTRSRAAATAASVADAAGPVECGLQ